MMLSKFQSIIDKFVCMYIYRSFVLTVRLALRHIYQLSWKRKPEVRCTINWKCRDINNPPNKKTKWSSETIVFSAAARSLFLRQKLCIHSSSSQLCWREEGGLLFSQRNDGMSEVSWGRDRKWRQRGAESRTSLPGPPSILLVNLRCTGLAKSALGF